MSDAIPAHTVDRYWSKVRPFIALDACWLWEGRLDGKREYGVFYFRHEGTRNWKVAHRVAYELLIGPIPEGLMLDHLCRNGRCVNPDHLEPVTCLINTQRGFLGRRRRRDGECMNGHKHTPETSWIDSRGYTQCRICERSRKRPDRRSRRAA